MQWIFMLMGRVLIGVGGLLLVVGYFAPLPPKRLKPAGRS